MFLFDKRPGKQRGFNLIELLIGMAISMIGLLAVALIFSDFGKQRNTQSQTGESQTNGTMALYLLERDLGQAGYGMMALQNCPFINYYYNGSGHYSTPYSGAISGVGTAALTTLPVRIYDGGTGSDAIEIQFGDSVSGVPGAEVTSAVTYPGGYPIQSAVGFSSGDRAVVNTNNICTLVAVTNSNPVTSPILHDITNPYNVLLAPGGTGWNSITSAHLTQTPKPYLANLGNFVSRRYAVTPNGTASSMTLAELPAFSANTVVDDIVFLKAQYGLAATATSTVVTTWVDGNTVIDNTNANRVIAVRIGVVARSPLYEKDEVVTASTFTLLQPATAGGALTDPAGGQCDTEAATMEVKCTAPDKHYRYRAFSTVVPLKNVIWTR